MDDSPPGPAVPGVLQARTLEWVAMSSSNEYMCDLNGALVAQMVKNLPAMQETRVHSLDQKDHLEKGMATHSIIFAWEISWTEEPGGLQSMGLQRVGQD